VPESRIEVVAVNDGKPYVSPPPDAEGPYKYYLLANTPVRVICDEVGVGYGAEAPDLTNGGALEVANTLLGPIEKGDDAEPITKDEFMESCRRTASESPP
jgi:hypothetical protein